MSANFIKKNAYVFVLLFLILLSIVYIIYGSTTYKIIKVKDGDTVVTSKIFGIKSFTCRLYGIDAPETGKKGQPYSEEASKELTYLILGQTIEVIKTGDKTYNREVCMINKNGLDINLEMVKRGYAWAYRKYLSRPYASVYIDAENEARTKKLGLWQQSNPQPPWEFRKQMRAQIFE